MLVLVKLFFGDMLKEITSKSNPYIKELVKLKSKSNKKSNHFIIEGERFVYEAIKRNIKIQAVLFVNEPAFLNELKCDCIKITNEIAGSLSSTVSTSGIFAVVEYNLQEFALPKGNFLVLDRISDPGNLGTIIRTALALDFKQIYLYNCVSWQNDKVLRSTMGTIFDICLYEVDFDKISLLTKFNLIKADMNGVDVQNFEHNKEICGLILGNEANGISPEIKQLTNNCVSVPMRNNVESLNVAIAGAILMSKFFN